MALSKWPARFHSSGMPQALDVQENHVDATASSPESSWHLSNDWWNLYGPLVVRLPFPYYSHEKPQWYGKIVGMEVSLLRVYMGISWNGGTPKSSILRIFHYFWGIHISGNSHINSMEWMAPPTSHLSSMNGSVCRIGSQIWLSLNMVSTVPHIPPNWLFNGKYDDIVMIYDDRQWVLGLPIFKQNTYHCHDTDTSWRLSLITFISIPWMLSPWMWRDSNMVRNCGTNVWCVYT